MDEDPARLRVLLVEDSPGDAALLRSMLDRPGMRLHLAVSLREARSILQAQQTDIVVVDLHEPGESVLAEMSRLAGDFPRVPLVVLAGSEDENLGMSVLQHGADDCLPKADASLRLLHRAIRYACERKRRLPPADR
jgi:phosphoserine phosphatase RsbU/P